jgi:putative chitinase
MSQDSGIIVTAEQLGKIMPYAGKRLAGYLTPLNAALSEFEISNIRRVASFLAQIAHESGELRYVRELASGEAYDTGAKALSLGNTPEKDGDGQRYKGRGLIQITGRTNYKACGLALGLDLLRRPELLEEPIHACRSAAWFWKTNGLNELADRGDFRKITRRINGGYNGMEDRLKYHARALIALGLST